MEVKTKMNLSKKQLKAKMSTTTVKGQLLALFPVAGDRYFYFISDTDGTNIIRFIRLLFSNIFTSVCRSSYREPDVSSELLCFCSTVFLEVFRALFVQTSCTHLGLQTTKGNLTVADAEVIPEGGK